MLVKAYSALSGIWKSKLTISLNGIWKPKLTMVLSGTKLESQSLLRVKFEILSVQDSFLKI